MGSKTTKPLHSNDDADFPNIPDLPENLVLPVRSLLSFACIFRGVFIQLADGKPLKEIVAERGEYLEMGDKVIDAWVAKLPLDDDEREE